MSPASLEESLYALELLCVPSEHCPHYNVWVFCLLCFICRQKGKKPFKSLRNLKIDLDLTAEGDLNIIMALAEKIKPGLHSFIFGRPFYTSVQERDVLMTF